MAMSVGKDESDDASIADINTTPLVDVMLVLLIIFLITVPVIKKMAEVDIPKAVNIPTQTKPENITISVDSTGKIFWNDLFIANTPALIERLKRIAVLDPQPELQIRGDMRANYEGVGKVVYAAQRAGIAKIGFVTEPPVRGGS